MNITQILEFYQLISEASASLQERKDGLSLRKYSLQEAKDGKLIKVAFDTRRINQEEDYNPRRGLQNYHRSEQFITETQLEKIGNFTKLKDVLEDLKKVYGREPEWQDSYCRVLLNTLDKTLRVVEQDGDYGDTQPAVGSFDYVEELLYARYRLDVSNISKYGEEELKNILLLKDEAMVRSGYSTGPKKIKNVTSAPTYEISKREVLTKDYDALIDKLLKARAAEDDNDRGVTITIRIGKDGKING